MRIISFIKDGRRVDMPLEKFQKMLEAEKAALEKKEVPDKEVG